MFTRKNIIFIGALLSTSLTTIHASDERSPQPGSAQNLRLSDKQLRQCFNLGLQYQNEGKLPIAEQFYRRIASVHPTSMNNLGLVLEAKGEWKEAEACYRQAIVMGFPDSQRHLGTLLGRRNINNKEADEWLEKASKSGFPDALFNLGVILRRRGDIEGAITRYREATAAGYLPAASNLAILLAEKGGQDNLQEAEALLRMGLASGNTSAINNLGNVLVKKSDRDSLQEAEALFRRAIDLSIDEARSNLGSLLERRGATEEAIIQYREALRMGTGNILVTSNLGNLLIRKGDPASLQEAEVLLRGAVGTGDTGVMTNLGSLLLQKGDRDSLQEAEVLLRRAAGAGETAAISNLAHLLERKNNPDSLQEAEVLLRRAAGAGETAAMNNLAILLARRNDQDSLQEADGLYRRCIIRTGNPEAMNNLANLLIKRGNEEDALQYYIAAAEKGLKDSQFNAGLLLLKGIERLPEGVDLRNTEKALNYFIAAAEHGMTHAMVELAKIHMGRYGHDFLDLPKAIFWMTKADALGNEIAKEYVLALPGVHSMPPELLEKLLGRTEVLRGEQIPISQSGENMQNKAREEHADADRVVIPVRMEEPELKEKEAEEHSPPRVEATADLQPPLDEDPSSAKASFAQHAEEVQATPRQKIKTRKQGLISTVQKSLAEIFQLKKQRDAEKEEGIKRTPSSSLEKKVFKIRNGKVSYESIVILFEDKFFKDRVQVYKTKNGLKIVSHIEQEAQVMATHNKHAKQVKQGRVKSQYSDSFRNELEDVLEKFGL